MRRSIAVAGLGIAVIVLEALPGLPVPTFRLQADAATTWLRAHPGGSMAMYPIKRAVAGGPARPVIHRDQAEYRPSRQGNAEARVAFVFGIEITLLQPGNLQIAARNVADLRL